MVAYYSCQIPIPFFGAGDGARTHDLDLGKVALYQLSYARKKEEQNYFSLGAGDGARTHDLDLGKVALYQLSYARENEFALAIIAEDKWKIKAGAEKKTRTSTGGSLLRPERSASTSSAISAQLLTFFVFVRPWSGRTD